MGQDISASKFKMFVDKGKNHESAKLEEVKVGVQFFYRGIQYTVVDMMDDMQVKLEGKNGAATRTSIVDLAQLCKSGSDYIMVRI